MVENLFKRNLLLVLLCLGCSSCALNPVARDLTGYVNNDIIRISEMETVSLKRYREVTGANYTSDGVLIKTLKLDIIPVYRRFVELLKEIRPQTEEVKRLHKIYIDGSESIYQGLCEILGGVQLQDVDMIRAGNSKLEAGRKKTEKWRERLFVLFEKNGVTPEKE